LPVPGADRPAAIRVLRAGVSKLPLGVFEFLDFAATRGPRISAHRRRAGFIRRAVAADACGRLWIQGLAAERRAIGKVKK